MGEAPDPVAALHAFVRRPAALPSGTTGSPPTRRCVAAPGRTRWTHRRALVPAALGTPLRRCGGPPGDLAQLGASPQGYVSRERFLTELTLDPPDATGDESGPPGRDEDYLILSTMHSAKGQEWTAVYVLNVVDGCIPSDMATGSDRRDR